MRVLFDHSTPFALAHGGLQVQIEQTASALRQIGVEVENLRWWDESQRGDIIHYFGRPNESSVHLAQQKGIKVVVSELLTETGSRSGIQRLVQKSVMQVARGVLPESFTARMAWKSYTEADAIIALTAWEAHLMHDIFGAPPSRIHVVPNGVEEVFFRADKSPRSPWLVCTATITARKRVLELIEAAVSAQTPVWIIGRPYSERDPYAARFEQFARSEPQWVRYEGAVQDRVRLAQIYRQARGFVLLSAMESLSLSALEASACECPLLLSDLPWARTVFGEQAMYCPTPANTTETATWLKRFYAEAPHRPAPPKPKTWNEVAGQLKAIYERLSTSR